MNYYNKDWVTNYKNSQKWGPKVLFNWFLTSMASYFKKGKIKRGSWLKVYKLIWKNLSRRPEFSMKVLRIIKLISMIDWMERIIL